MKIITLGTSHGATEVGRACSGTLLMVNGASYLFDCGGNIEGKMTDLGLAIKDIRSVFISHMHEDHAGSLSAIAKRFVSYIKTGERVNMYLPEENGITAFKNWLLALHFSKLKLDKLIFNLIQPGEIYRDENITVSAIPTQHLFNGKFPSYAFVVQAAEKKLLYTGDLACDFHDYPQIVFEEDFDAIVCELVHFDVENNLETISKSRTKKLIFTHMAPRNIPTIKNNEEKFPFPVYIAEDCMPFEV